MIQAVLRTVQSIIAHLTTFILVIFLSLRSASALPWAVYYPLIFPQGLFIACYISQHSLFCYLHQLANWLTAHMSLSVYPPIHQRKLTCCDYSFYSTICPKHHSQSAIAIITDTIRITGDIFLVTYYHPLVQDSSLLPKTSQECHK